MDLDDEPDDDFYSEFKDGKKRSLKGDIGDASDGEESEEFEEGMDDEFSDGDGSMDEDDGENDAEEEEDVGEDDFEDEEFGSKPKGKSKAFSADQYRRSAEVNQAEAYSISELKC